MRWSGSISTNDAVVPLADKIRKNIFILQGRGGERAAARRRRERGRAGNAPRRCPLFNERTEKRGSRAADPTKQGFQVVIPGSLAFSVFAAGPIFCDLGSVRFQDGGCTCFILIVNRNISFSTVYFAHGVVVVRGGRQPVFVLRLAPRKQSSPNSSIKAGSGPAKPCFGRPIRTRRGALRPPPRCRTGRARRSAGQGSIPYPPARS